MWWCFSYFSFVAERSRKIKERIVAIICVGYKSEF